MPAGTSSVQNDLYLFKQILDKVCLDDPAGITCSKLTIETLEQGVKYVQS